MRNNPNARVLVVSYTYYPVVGGLPRQAHLLNRAIQEQGMFVTVATARMKGYPNFEILDNVPIYRLWTLRGGPMSYRSRIYPWLLSLGTFLIVHQDDFDVIHVHQASYPAAICVVIGKMLSKPTVIRITGSGVSGNIAVLKKWWWLGSLVRLIIRNTDCFVSLSEDITSELLAEGIPGEKIVRIDNGIDTAFYSPVALQADAPRIKTVLGVGRLSDEKGFDILIKAWAQVINKEPYACLVIVGDGLESQALKSMAQRLDIGNSVSFEGNRDNIVDYLTRADIFVLPSRNEGMSNALLEAMSMGRACIASDIPANDALLTHGVDGLMFNVNDPEDLALRILELLRDSDLGQKLGANARKKITSRFSIVEKATTYINLYSRLFAGDPPKISTVDTK